MSRSALPFLSSRSSFGIGIYCYAIYWGKTCHPVKALDYENWQRLVRPRKIFSMTSRFPSQRRATSAVVILALTSRSHSVISDFLPFLRKFFNAATMPLFFNFGNFGNFGNSVWVATLLRRISVSQWWIPGFQLLTYQ